jgi:nucleoside phosphorylase
MRILVTFAVEAEFAPWRSIRNFTRQEAPGLSLWKSVIAGSDVFVVLTGIGDHSGSVLDLMLRVANAEKHFDVCVSSGLAGALKPEFELNDIVAAKLLQSERLSADLGRNSLDTDPELANLAVKHGARAVNVSVTTARVLTTSHEKSRHAGTADIVEMESFDVIKEAYIWGARGIAIRAISDRASENLPIDFNKTLSANHTVSIPRVLGQVAKNPASLGSLLRFGRQSRTAAESLAKFLDAYLSALVQLPREHSSMKVAAR